LLILLIVATLSLPTESGRLAVMLAGIGGDIGVEMAMA